MNNNSELQSSDKKRGCPKGTKNQEGHTAGRRKKANS